MKNLYFFKISVFRMECFKMKKDNFVIKWSVFRNFLNLIFYGGMSLENVCEKKKWDCKEKSSKLNWGVNR